MLLAMPYLVTSHKLTELTFDRSCRKYRGVGGKAFPSPRMPSHPELQTNDAPIPQEKRHAHISTSSDQYTPKIFPTGRFKHLMVLTRLTIDRKANNQVEMKNEMFANVGFPK